LGLDLSEFICVNCVISAQTTPSAVARRISCADLHFQHTSGEPCISLLVLPLHIYNQENKSGKRAIMSIEVQFWGGRERAQVSCSGCIHTAKTLNT